MTDCEKIRALEIEYSKNYKDIETIKAIEQLYFEVFGTKYVNNCSCNPNNKMILKIRKKVCQNRKKK